jgi:uncharacterized membrane-anchored protein
VLEVLFLLKWVAIVAVGLFVLLLILAWIGSKLPDVPEEETKPVAKVKRPAAYLAQSAGVDDRVKRRLIALCYGDQAMAHRLADCARRPGCSQQWAWEKALEDLEHDLR